MTDFIIHFLICNLLISGMIGILFAIKKILTSHLTGRIQYNLRFLPLCLMTVPFIPIRSDRIFSLLPWLTLLNHNNTIVNRDADTTDILNPSDTASDWMNDFTVFVSSRTPSLIGMILLGIWIIGILAIYESEKIRYMLLHKLQHYRRKDNISNHLLLLAEIFYWFNPLVWLAAGAMRSDREIACDSAVLDMLDADSYREYGDIR